MKEIEDYIFLYNMQDVLTSLAVDIDFMKKMRSKFNLSHFKLCNTCFVFMRI